MDVDTDDHGEEGITFSGVDAHIMKMVVIEYPVINPFAGSTVIVNHLIFLCSPGDRSIESDIPVGFCVDTASIGRLGTFFFTSAGIHSAAGERAAPFAGMLLPAIPPVDHAVTSHAQRSAVYINRDGIRNGIRPAAVVIQINERPYLPFLAKAVGSIVVIGGIQAEVTDSDIRINGLKFPEGNDSRDAVVALGIEEAEMEREVNPGASIMGAEHVKGMAEIKDFLVAVPPPVSIRVGEMAPAGAVECSVIQTVTGLMSVRGGMRMDTGTVTGKGQAVFWDEPFPEGRQDRGKPEKALEPVFIMKRELFMGQGISGNGLSDAGMFIRKFLPFTGFFGRLFVLMSREQIFPASFLQMCGLCPEPVHEVKIRAKRRQGIRSAANENGKKTVSLKFFNPGGKACKAEHDHKDKGTDDLGLVFGWTPQMGIEA